MSANPVKKIAHIGIAVKSINQSLPFYTKNLGLTLEKMTEVKSEGVKVAFIKIGETRFELLEPLHEQSPIHRFIEKKGEGIHHIALEVDDIDARLEYLKSENTRLVDEHKKSGADGVDVAFLHPKTAYGVLFELCQTNEGEQ